MNKEINFVLDSEPEEIFLLIEGFLERWLMKFADKEGIDKEREAYNFLPTDKQKLEIIKELKKDWTRYYKK